MDNRLEKLLASLKSIRMPPEKSTLLRERLEEYMLFLPVTNHEDRRLHGRTEGMSAFPALFTFIRTRPMPLIIALVFAVTAGGGVSVAAEQAVPGDALYPVKIGVNEEVRGWFALSEEAEAKWQAARAGRRLAEAAELAAEERLSAETRANLEARVQTHIDAAESRAARVEETDRVRDAAELRSAIESAIAAHVQVLAAIEAETEISTSTRAEIGTLLEKLNARLEKAAGLRADATARLSARADVMTEGAAEGKLRAARNVFDAAVRAYEQNEAKLSASVKADVEAQIAAAEEALVESEAALEAENYAEAFVAAQLAQRISHEVLVLSRAGAALHLRLNFLGSSDAGRDGENDDRASREENRDEDNDSRATSTPNETDQSRATDEDAVRVDAEAEVEIEAETDGDARGTGSGSGRGYFRLPF